MIRQKQQLFPIITSDIQLTIILELIEEKELSVYDLNSDLYTLAQYRYALKKLLTNRIIQSKLKGKKIFYTLSSDHKDKIRSLLSCYASFDKKNVLRMLKNFKGWAFRDKSALLHYLPFLNLFSSKYTISVRSVKEREKLESAIPEVGSVLDIKVQPTYFRTSKQYIHKFNNYPVLRPEVLFSRLLRSPDSRVRLSSVFLLPYMRVDDFYKQIQEDDRTYLTAIYLIHTLNDFIREKEQTKKTEFLKNWFSNVDLIDYQKNFDRFLKAYHKTRRRRQIPDSYFRKLHTNWKKKNLCYTKWDRAADLVPDRLVTFDPEALGELISVKI